MIQVPSPFILSREQVALVLEPKVTRQSEADISSRQKFMRSPDVWVTFFYETTLSKRKYNNDTQTIRSCDKIWN